MQLLARKRPLSDLHGGGDLHAHLAAARPVLDSLRTNVFVASLDLELVYANPMAMQTMRAIEGEFSREFGIPISSILGGSIHRFHRNPERVERILHGHGSLPHEAAFSFGAVTLSTQIGALDGPGRQRLGYIVTWQDISQLKRSVGAIGQLSEQWQSAASTVEQLGASIAEISRSATGAAGLATESADTVAEATTLVERLAGAAREISSVTQLIDEIAGQTNLLALNATIEAARAGEAGRGFAVVAHEVKELASSTSAATEQIGRQVSAIQQAVESVRRSTDQYGESIAQVSEYTNAIAAAVEEQSVVAQDLARTIQGAADYSESTVQGIRV